MKITRLLCLVLALMCCLAAVDTALAANCFDSHTPVTDPASEPTCSRAGKTEGSHCSKCGQTLVQQQIIPMLGHEFSQTPGFSAGFGYHKHHCKRCGSAWAIHCTLLADNHCVTCEYFMTTLQAGGMTPDAVEAEIAKGAPMIVITPMEPMDYAKRFKVEMYEAGAPIDFTIEATIQVPLTDDELAQVETGALALYAETVVDDVPQNVELDFEVVDGMLTFRSAILGEYFLGPYAE